MYFTPVLFINAMFDRKAAPPGDYRQPNSEVNTKKCAKHVYNAKIYEEL